jgi:L-ectoine synthase
MIVKQTDMMHSLEPDRCVAGIGFESIRFILADDNMGFSLHKTIIPKGGPYHWHYKNHKEACFCIKGEGELVNLSNGNRFIIAPDMVYILNEHDNHTFEAFEDVELISVFNPPVKGNEIHKEDGSYEII